MNTGCGTPKESNKDNTVQEAPEMDQNKIVFLYFNIEKDKHNKLTISLMETQVVEGSLKENTVKNAPSVEGNLIVQLMDDKQRVKEEQVIQDPLDREMEVYLKEDTLTKEVVSIEKGDFFIRFNRNENINSIKIFKIQSQGKIEVFNKPISI